MGEKYTSLQKVCLAGIVLAGILIYIGALSPSWLVSGDPQDHDDHEDLGNTLKDAVSQLVHGDLGLYLFCRKGLPEISNECGGIHVDYTNDNGVVIEGNNNVVSEVSSGVESIENGVQSLFGGSGYASDPHDRAKAVFTHDNGNNQMTTTGSNTWCIWGHGCQLAFNQQDSGWVWACRIAGLVCMLLSCINGLCALCLACCGCCRRFVALGISTFFAAGLGAFTLVSVGVHPDDFTQGFLGFKIHANGWGFYVFAAGVVLMLVLSFVACCASPKSVVSGFILSPAPASVIIQTTSSMSSNPYVLLHDHSNILQASGGSIRVSQHYHHHGMQAGDNSLFVTGDDAGDRISCGDGGGFGPSPRLEFLSADVKDV